MDVLVNSRLRIPATELTWRFSRSSGPGGQHVNTTDTGAEVRWNIAASRSLTSGQQDLLITRLGHRLVGGDLVVRSTRYRSQMQNRQDALEKLAEIVRTALAPAPRARRATRPTRGSVKRGKQAKRHRSELKALRRRPPLD